MMGPDVKGKPLTILLIEDNPGDARLIKELLSESRPASFSMDTADRLSQGMDRAEKGHYDAILLDLGLPDSRGLDTFTKLHTAFKHIPIVVLSGLNDESVALAAVQEGAQDYLVKGQADGHILSHSIRYAIERKQAEELLIASERKYRSLVENINDVLYTLDTRGNITYISPVVERFTKYKISDLTGKPFVSLIYADDLPGLLDSFSRLASGQMEPWEFRVLDKDGKIIFVRTSSRPIYVDGQITGFTALMTDITERKRAEDELVKSEVQYRLLADHMTDTVWLMDRDLKITYYSPSVEKMRGFTVQEIMHLPMEKRVTPESHKLTSELFMKEMPRVEADPGYNPVFTLDIEYYCKDGTTVWTENRLSIIRDDSGRLVSILGESRNISERKQSDIKLLKSYESLKKTLNDAINTMVKIVEMRDPYTAGHQQKVAALATAIAGEMKLEDSRIDQLRMAALIHDIGKMYVPSDILSRPGKLSNMEFSLIKSHAQSGYDIVKSMDFPCDVAEAVMQHHERLDGSGYPNQLRGEDTLLESKILAVADVIEAMSSHRPYRPAPGIDKALQEIEQNSGKLYDPDVVDICIRLFREKAFSFEQQAL